MDSPVIRGLRWLAVTALETAVVWGVWQTADIALTNWRKRRERDARNRSAVVAEVRPAPEVRAGLPW